MQSLWSSYTRKRIQALYAAHGTYRKLAKAIGLEPADAPTLRRIRVGQDVSPAAWRKVAKAVGITTQSRIDQIDPATLAAMVANRKEYNPER